MIETQITKAFGLTAPILSAGMAFVSRPQFAAAVSNAGGMGFLDADIAPPHALAELIRATHRLTTQPFGLDVMTAFFTEQHLEACLDEPPAVVNFLWGYPDPQWVEKLKRAGSQVWMEVRSVQEAKGARQYGLDGLVVQAPARAGGAGLMTLLPAVVDAARVPVVAAGSITDGRGVAAALVLGAEAVRCGTLFLSATEANDPSEGDPRALTSADGTRQLNGPARRPEPTSAALEKSVVRDWAQRTIQAKAASLAARRGGAPHASPDDSLPRLSDVLAASDGGADDEWRDVVLPPEERTGAKRNSRPVAAIVQDLAAETESILAKHSLSAVA